MDCSRTAQRKSASVYPGRDLDRIRKPGKRTVEFTAVISSDEAGDNVLDKSPYFLRIPLRLGAATGERDASDCPPGLRVFGSALRRATCQTRPRHSVLPIT